MLLLHITQLLCSSVPDELCAPCFEKANPQSGDEHEHARKEKRKEESEKNGTEQNGRNGTERNGAEGKERQGS